MSKINLFKEFFFFSQGEKKGLIILCSLVLMMFAINFCLPQQNGYAEQVIQQADSLVTQTEDSTLLLKPHYTKRDGRQSDSALRFKEKAPFNSQKRTHTSYPKGNQFNQKGMKNDYESLRIELNSADTTELKKLRGIGSKLSQRIVKYRTKLGGFTSKEQLKAVYGLSEETYEAILPHVWIDSTLSQK